MVEFNKSIASQLVANIQSYPEPFSTLTNLLYQVLQYITSVFLYKSSLFQITLGNSGLPFSGVFHDCQEKYNQYASISMSWRLRNELAMRFMLCFHRRISLSLLPSKLVLDRLREHPVQQVFSPWGMSEEGRGRVTSTWQNVESAVILGIFILRFSGPFKLTIGDSGDPQALD